MSREAYVASVHVNPQVFQRIYGTTDGVLCAECFLAGYRVVVA